MSRTPSFDEKLDPDDFVTLGTRKIPRYTRELWTAKQRQASSIHEVSYRACFKPQLPRFFIERFSKPLDVIYDPFSGRGTTVLEAGLLGRRIISNDINPLSEILTKPRFFIPNIDDVQDRLNKIFIEKTRRIAEIDLSMFYHPDTESEIVALKEYLNYRRENEKEDDIDRWLRMVATNRLTGHSNGFFSVYTLPPNQAVSQDSQRKINDRLHQRPEYRDVKKIIVRKTKSLTRALDEVARKRLRNAGKSAIFTSCDARRTCEIHDESAQLVVTSPPFLDIVQYSHDNWLRCWFNSINVNEISKNITMARTLGEWSEVMGLVFRELFRITKRGGHVAFEVGEVRKGKINLDEHVVPLGISAGFECKCIVHNKQRFTKTSHIWGISNNAVGTNTNMIVLFEKRRC